MDPVQPVTQYADMGSADPHYAGGGLGVGGGVPLDLVGLDGIKDKDLVEVYSLDYLSYPHEYNPKEFSQDYKEYNNGQEYSGHQEYNSQYTTEYSHEYAGPMSVSSVSPGSDQSYSLENSYSAYPSTPSPYPSTPSPYTPPPPSSTAYSQENPGLKMAPAKKKGGRKKNLRPPSPQILKMRREAANARERKRMNGLNDAFERLREVSRDLIIPLKSESLQIKSCALSNQK